MDLLPISEGFTDELGDLVAHALKGDEVAFEAAQLVFSSTHVWDDLIDGDRELTAGEINGAFWALSVGLWKNSFWYEHHAQLLPLLENGVYAWLDANQLEQDGMLEAAFALRCAVLDVILRMAQIVGGVLWMREVSPGLRAHVLDDFDAYRQEHSGE